jgi:tRNA(Ile)-lysidine synthetase-like protein
MFEKIKIETEKLISAEAQKRGIVTIPRVILGLSGGSDSVFLFYLLQTLAVQGKLELFAAHLDHGWRQDSSLDAHFCQQLCEAYTIPLVSEHAHNIPLAIKFNGSHEEVGRKLRRYFFEKTREQFDAHFIALAHHQQDQQETFFMRLLRGSSLAGLSCMAPVEGYYLRPLLKIAKNTMLDYLYSNRFEYVQDPTNSSPAYLRNKIRMFVLPALKSCDERFDQKFESTLQHLRTEHEFLDNLTQELFVTFFIPQKACAGQKAYFLGSCVYMNGIDKVMRRRLIIYWLVQEKVSFQPSEGFLHEIDRFLSSSHGGTHALSCSWKIVKKQHQFWIVKTETNVSEIQQIDDSSV